MIIVKQIQKVPEEGFFHVQVDGTSIKAFIYKSVFNSESEYMNYQTEAQALEEATKYAKILANFKPIESVVWNSESNQN